MKLDTAIPGIKKYYIGFGVFGVLLLGMTVYTLSLASAAKQDKQTLSKAQDIADKLNDSIRDQNRIPNSLDEIGVKDVPKTIRYTKKSDTQYEFCVVYKTASSFSTPDVTSALTGPLLGGYSGTMNDYYGDTELSSYKPSYLYISSFSHKKGEDCQTIEPYLSTSSRSSTSLFDTPSSSSSLTNAARDTERRADINSLHGQIEAYYAQFGRYPTLDNLNSATWRSTNMRGLDTEALRDPLGSSSQLVSSGASKNVYTYKVYGKGGISETCDNVNTDCAQYALSATLSSNIAYTKINLN